MKTKELFESLNGIFIIEESFKQFNQFWYEWLKNMPDHVKHSNHPLVSSKEEKISQDLAHNATFGNSYLWDSGAAPVLEKMFEITNTSKLNEITPPIVLEYLINNNIKFDVDGSAGSFPGNPNDISSWIGVMRKGDPENFILFLSEAYKKFAMVAERKIERDMLKNPEYDIVHLGSNFSIFQVYNIAAACKFGKGGHWCISSGKMKMTHLDNYLDYGLEVYIIHTEKGGGPWAVIFDAEQSKIFEIQNQSNDLGDPHQHLPEFLNQLENVGVVIDEFISSFPFDSYFFNVGNHRLY